MRIGILTSGGDTPGMNAVIRSVLLRTKQFGYELIGFKDGWKGLLDNDTMDIPNSLLDNIDLGGTILGSGRVNPLKKDGGIDKIKQTLSSEGIDALIAIGGEDTLGVANELYKNGIPIVGVPKTIDNDLDATDYTFGFNTAITIATEAIDRLKTTAKSHHRVIVVEIMGRHAGWMALHAGIAGGAHVILIPEYKLENKLILDIIQERYNKGDTWGIVVVSEGYLFKNTSGETDEFGHVRLEKLEVGKAIADMINKELSIPTRAVVLGHTQRGGPPTAFDRVLCTQLGLKAVELIKMGKFGKMPALRGTKIVPVDLEEAVSKLKTVDEESWEIAKQIMGII